MATSEGGGRPSAMQLSSLSRICDAYRGEKRYRVQLFRGSLQSALRFCAWLHWKRCQQATSKEGLVSLPDPGAKMADGSALFTGSDLEAWRDWRWVLLRSPSEFHDVIAREGRVAPHTDPELKRKPQSYARLVRDMSLRGLVSFGHLLRPLSEFLWPRRNKGNRGLSNQHLRRPWHCVLPAPASWAGFPLSSHSAYHMAQTDVNAAFYRILAPTGMSEYFILPNVSTQLLLREGVKVPDHLRHLPDVSPQLQVRAVGFSCALYLCKKDGGSCVRAPGFSPDALLTDRHRAPAMARIRFVSGFTLMVYVPWGCDRPKVLSAMVAVKAILGRRWFAVLRG